MKLHYGSQIKNWFSKHLWNFLPRYLMEFKPVWDICNCHVGFSDYGYMCRPHAEVYYHTLWIYVPKFIFRLWRKRDGYQTVR